MDELELVILVFKGIFWLIRAVLKLAFAIVKLVFLGVTWPIRALVRRSRAETSTRRAVPEKMKKAAQQKQVPRAKLDDLADLLQRTRVTEAAATELRELAATLRNTDRFVPTLDALLARNVELAAKVRRKALTRVDASRALARDEALLAMVSAMVNDRRAELAGLVGDTDALANAAYAPIVKYCVDRGIALTSDRAATVIDGDKLFFMSVDDPTGLAAIVLPASFSSSIMTWPAVAHEIAHDFFHSVEGLPQQLRTKLRLGNDLSLLKPTDGRATIAEVPERTTAAWMEELFADAFGTMMLGPAYIETMMASFASPDDPGRALAAMAAPRGTASPSGREEGPPRGDGDVYEEHPPGHVRVISGCRLLAQMGYGKVADALEARWRKLHGDANVVFVPLTDRRWLKLPEAGVLDRAAEVGSTLYMEGQQALRGQPLRSIAGLDFGPREHETAKRLAERLRDGRPAEMRDARLLVAAAVIATVQAPAHAAEIYARARAAIDGVDVPRSMLDGSARPSDALDAAAMRDAFVFGELLGPPLSRRAARSTDRR